VNIDAREQGPAARRDVARPVAADNEQSDQITSERRGGLTPLSLLIVLAIGYLLIQVQFVLVLVLMSLVFATVIQTPVDALERRRVPRPLAILLVYVALIAAVTMLFLFLSPIIREQAATFRTQAPESLAELRAAWQDSGVALLNGPGQQLLGRAISFIENPEQVSGIPVPQGAAIGLLTGLGGGIIGVVTVLIISFYYLMEKAWIRRLALFTTSPETRIRVSRTLDEVEEKVGGWLRGQLTLCLIIGVTATIGYAVMGVNFWPLLGLWAGITEIVPILGPWLGGVPAVIIALTQGWEKALLVVGFILLLQMTENAILVPRIMRGAVGLTPLTVFIAILVGTEFAGVAGALLAIPVAAAIQVLLSQYTEARREARLAGLSALPGWRWMRGSVAPPGFSPVITTPAAARGQPETAEIVPSPSGWSAETLARESGRDQESSPGGNGH
jgi:predicted PurR-regulated permease PerM